jgi:hypothetical protein
LAVKFLDKISEHPGGTYYFEKLVDAPGIVYGAMLICFFAGATFLVISSTVQLMQREEND